MEIRPDPNVSPDSLILYAVDEKVVRSLAAKLVIAQDRVTEQSQMIQAKDEEIDRLKRDLALARTDLTDVQRALIERYPTSWAWDPYSLPLMIENLVRFHREDARRDGYEDGHRKGYEAGVRFEAASHEAPWEFGPGA